MSATHKEIKVFEGFQEITLQPGQFIFGRLKAAAALNLSEREVRTCLNTLKTTNNLSVKTTNKFSIVTLINWEKYQCDDIENDQQNDQQGVPQATSKRPTKDQQATTYKNEKNEKNDKKRERGNFVPPTIDQVIYYFKEKNYLDPEYQATKFWNHHESKGWIIGKVKMKNWHAAAATWNLNGKKWKEEKPLSAIKNGGQETDWDAEQKENERLGLSKNV